jgi:large subunit ribosomal protein L27
MSHVKAGGTAKNIHNNAGQRLGVKLFGGEKVTVGQIIVRQVGMTKRPGVGTKLAANYSIHAARDGVVTYQKRKFRTFTGRSVYRTEVQVQPVA